MWTFAYLLVNNILNELHFPVARQQVHPPLLSNWNLSENDSGPCWLSSYSMSAPTKGSGAEKIWMPTVPAEKLIIALSFYKVYHNLTELPKALSHLRPPGLSGQDSHSPGPQGGREQVPSCSTGRDSQEEAGQEA